MTFVAYILAQVLIFNKLVLFGNAFCFIYLGFLLTFPFELAVIPAMLIGLSTGLTVDIFTNTPGMHAAASVLVMYVRPRLLDLLTPQGGYPAGVIPKPSVMGFQWFASYALILIFLHQFVLFFIEYGGFEMFFRTFLKVISSSLFTFIMVLLVQYMFVFRKRRA